MSLKADEKPRGFLIEAVRKIPLFPGEKGEA